MKWTEEEKEKRREYRESTRKKIMSMAHGEIKSAYMRLFDDHQRALDNIIIIGENALVYMSLYEHAKKELEKLRGEKQ